MKTVEEYLNIALGGNMNIATLKPKFWHEIMTDYAKYYHKESTTKPAQAPRQKSGWGKPIDELIEIAEFFSSRPPIQMQYQIDKYNKMVKKLEDLKSLPAYRRVE